MDGRRGLQRAIEATEQVVRGVRVDQFDQKTVCGDWDVRDLLNHIIGQLEMLDARLRGDEPGHLMKPGALPRGDLVGDEPLSAYGRAADDVLEAATSDDAVRAAGMLVGITATDVLVHGWDLARVTGQDIDGADEVSEDLLAMVKQGITEENRAPMFGPEVVVADDAPAHVRLAGFLGRDLQRADRA